MRVRIRQLRFSLSVVGAMTLGLGYCGAVAPSIDVLVKHESPCYWQSRPAGVPTWCWGNASSASVTVRDVLGKAVSQIEVAKDASAWGTFNLPVTLADSLYQIEVSLDSGVNLTAKVARVATPLTLRGNPGMPSWGKVNANKPALFHYDASRDGASPESVSLKVSPASKTVALDGVAGYAAIDPLAWGVSESSFGLSLFYDEECVAEATMHVLGGLVLVVR